MAKRGNDDPQDSATAAPAIRLSSNFQDSSADIELRSKDGVRFLVHKANLSVSSTVFADMLQLATGGDQERPSLELDESAGVLESMLLYCYPKRVPPLEINPDADLKLLRALDKYEAKARRREVLGLGGFLRPNLRPPPSPRRPLRPCFSCPSPPLSSPRHRQFFRDAGPPRLHRGFGPSRPGSSLSV
ncbi:hypothetical protein BCR35DRAFT_315798 [Leucosporidium creatinivorum]|uniref:BTB domain-containing protein n=1 Tax=Leucosporidium creatinivorum TaxID=106004 RepID=A0A1Y2DGH5_9BASI|nr:hypothetical protein BCR35DRAFT_315798 [Leucosporidium creatinivorum]